MAQTIQKVSITHDAILDFVIARPDATYREIAAEFGYSPEGIGIICRSDAFRARMEVRKADLVDPVIKQTVEDRLQGLVHASIDILQRKLQESGDAKLALATLDATSRNAAANYGARNVQQGNQTTFVVQLPGPANSSLEWKAKFGLEEPILVEARAIAQELSAEHGVLARMPEALPNVRES